MLQFEQDFADRDFRSATKPRPGGVVLARTLLEKYRHSIML